jgi:hypothetical protein
MHLRQRPALALHHIAAGLAGLALALLSGCAHQSTPNASPAAALASTATVSAAKFSDATVEAGLDFVQLNGGCGKFYFAEMLAPGAATLDADGDGFLDLYFPSAQPLGSCAAASTSGDFGQRLYLNDRKGHFRLAPQAFGGAQTDYALAAAVGDYDSDGKPDLFVACYGRSRLFRNLGGRFEDVTERAGVGARGLASSAVWFDADGDAKWSVATDIACHTPDKQRGYCDPTVYPCEPGVFYRNNGDGTFTDRTRESGLSAATGHTLSLSAADFNGDGRLDLFVANDQTPNYLFINLGHGRFRNEATKRGVAFNLNGVPVANMGTAIGDYDDDGALDIATTTFSDESYTLFKNQGGMFTDVATLAGIGRPSMSYLGFGTGFFDSTNSGRLDLFYANGHIHYYARAKEPGQGFKQRNQLLINGGDGLFREELNALPADDIRVHRAACFGDFDNDGRIDILVTANNDRPTLLHNDSPQANWLQLQLIDKRGGATPIGARCVATIGGHKRVRVLLGGGSYGGDSDHRVHFGLAQATKIEQMEITWPSGNRQILRDISANQILTVREPAPATAS